MDGFKDHILISPPYAGFIFSGFANKMDRSPSFLFLWNASFLRYKKSI